MLAIPLSAVPSQQFPITLNEQDCTVKIYVRGARLYMDLAVNNETIRTGMVCLLWELVLQYGSTSFDGDFFFTDSRGGTGAPWYDGLGDRYTLYYLTNEEMEAAEWLTA